MGIGNVVSDAPWKVPIVAAYPVVYAFEPERERPVYGPGWRPAAVATVSVGSTDTGDSVLSGQS